jgi:hypothetical protein
VIFGGRESCKSLYEKELKIYGIFENSKIVQLLFVLFGLKASDIGQKQKAEVRSEKKKGILAGFAGFFAWPVACGGQDSDERAGRPILIRPPMASEGVN